MLGLVAAGLRRRVARTVLTSMGVAVGVAAIVALLAVTDGLEASASGLAHLGQADFALFQSGVSDPTASALPVSLVPRARRQPGVAEATPLQLVVGAVPHSPQSIVFGVDPASFVDRRLVLVSGRRGQGRGAMVGDGLARDRGLRVGGTITLRGRRFPVVGIYHSGVPFEDQGVILPLAAAQRLSGRRGEVTAIAVRVAPRASATSVAHGLQRAFPGTVAITNPGEAARADPNVQLVDKAVAVIVVVALVIGAIAVANTMVIAVLERERELALLAAVGWSPAQTAMLVLAEGLGLSLIGAALGLGLGVAASELVVRVFSASTVVSPSITAGALVRGVVIGVAIGALGGLYPAWRATRLLPAPALARA